MFTGEYEHSMDPKGRVIVPATYRNKLGDRFVITRGVDTCLYIYKEDDWNEFAENLQEKLAFSKEKNRIIIRQFMKNTVYCEFDKQGRVVIPPKLREYARLEKDLVLIGMSNKIEVWSKDLYCEADEDDIDIAAAMEEYDIRF